MKHVRSVAGGAGPEDETSEENKSEDSEGPTIRIDRFELRDAEVAAQILKDKTLDVPLPGIELNNLGGSEGASVGQVSTEVMGTVTGRVVAAVTKRALSLGAGGGSEKAKASDEAEASDEVEAVPTRREQRARRRENAEY